MTEFIHSPAGIVTVVGLVVTSSLWALLGSCRDSKRLRTNYRVRPDGTISMAEEDGEHVYRAHPELTVLNLELWDEEGRRGAASCSYTFGVWAEGVWTTHEVGANTLHSVSNAKRDELLSAFKAMGARILEVERGFMDSPSMLRLPQEARQTVPLTFRRYHSWGDFFGHED